MLGLLLFFIFINSLKMSCHTKHAVSGMFLYADDAKHFSSDLQLSLTSVNSWMEFYQLLLAPAKCQYLAIATLKLIFKIILEIKGFLVCLRCLIWLLLLVTLNDTSMFVALPLKLLFIHTKFYIVSAATMFGFCPKHILHASDHC